MAFVPVRSILETMRRRGFRLTASQDESLFEHEKSDSYFCSDCGCYFSSPNAEMMEMEQARQKHYQEAHQK